MRRWLAAIALVVVALAAVYFFLIRDTTVAPTVQAPRLTAVIGSGEDAVGVSSEGQVLRSLPVPDKPPLPQLPISEVPKGGRLRGPILEQALILGAAPAALRPYLARSHLGDSGIDVELSSGIELRFGDASQTARKWKAAAAVLADPTITALDYVDLHAPTHVAVGGSGHTLPAAP